MLGLVAKRQEQIAKGEKPGDVLSILLQNPVYQELDKTGALAIQDTLLVCLGGFRNPTSSIVNTIACLIQSKNADKLKNFREEVDAFFGDVVKNSAGKSAEEVKNLYAERLRNKSDEDLEYLSLCWNESMRLAPPFMVTTSWTMTQDVVLSEGTEHALKLHKNQPFTLGICVLHRDKDQYSEPDAFIPERWDSTHPYYKTPSGCPRDAKGSYIPLSGGKRNCLGKGWMEINHKILLSLIMHKVDIEFVDEAMKKETDFLNFFKFDTPVWKVKTTKRH